MRRKGRPERRWMDSVDVGLREKGLSVEETQNRAVWRQFVRYIIPHASGKRCGFFLTRFNKIAIQGTPQMAVDKEAISLSRA